MVWMRSVLLLCLILPFTLSSSLSSSDSDEDKKFSIGLDFSNGKPRLDASLTTKNGHTFSAGVGGGRGVSAGYVSPSGNTAIQGSLNNGQASVSISRGGARAEAVKKCTTLQLRFQKPANGQGCSYADQAECARRFEEAVSEAAVSAMDDEATPFMERCCHVWGQGVIMNDPFSKSACRATPTLGGGSGGGSRPRVPPSPQAVKLCLAAQSRWRRGGLAQCQDYHTCSLDFSREIQAFSEDSPGDAEALGLCCMAWERPVNQGNPFAGAPCVTLPRGGQDMNGGASGGRQHGDPAGAVEREQRHIARLKAQLRDLVVRHRQCNKICENREGAGRRECLHRCCKAKKAEQRRIEQEARRAQRLSRPAPGAQNDVHLVHRAIVSWVRRLVTSIERVTERDSVPSVLHAMAKVFCRKIQLRFNPMACVSGKHKCHIKFRDAIGVLKFPRGPRQPPSPYTRFIVQGYGRGRPGKDVAWCRFDWDENKAREQAAKMARRRLKEALRRRALAKARVRAVRAAQREKDQEERESKASMNLADFVVLAPGAKGPDAVALRFLLIANGIFRGEPVGDYDGEAVVAVQKAQERHGVRDNGVVDGKMWSHLVGNMNIRMWRQNNEFGVRAVQYLLKFKFGQMALRVCGVYNRETVAAIKNLQQRHGLPVTGAVGAREWPMLLTDLNEVPKNMNSVQCHRKLGLVLGGERAKSGKDCFEKDVYSNECCRIRAVFNCDKRAKADLAKDLLYCRVQSHLGDLKRKKEEEDRKKRELEEKAARAAMEWQRCGACKFVTLHVGDKGPEVAVLRYLLQEWEILPAQQSTPEQFDQPLSQLIQKLQKDKGMIPTGVVGTQTWLRLIGPEFLWKRAKFDRSIMGLQYVLRQKFGAQAVQITGKYDDVTERAVKAFQQAAGLKADGMVGGHTWSALLGAKGDSARLLARLRAEDAERAGLSTWVTLSLRSEGPAVAALKYLLKEHNLMASNNAVFDDATLKIVLEFRKKFNLDASLQRAGPRVWQALVSAGQRLVKGVNRPDAVRAAQYLFRHKFGLQVSVDGKFDDNFARIVAQFQAGNNIREDGIGPLTWQLLLSASNGPAFGPGTGAQAGQQQQQQQGLGGPAAPQFTSIQTESEIEEEITGLVRAVSQNLQPAQAAQEVCKALQSKFGAPNGALRQPGCLDGKMHCAEGFYLALGAIKRLTSLGPMLGSCHHTYNPVPGPLGGGAPGAPAAPGQPPQGNGFSIGVQKGSFSAGLTRENGKTSVGINLGKWGLNVGGGGVSLTKSA